MEVLWGFYGTPGTSQAHQGRSRRFSPLTSHMSPRNHSDVTARPSALMVSPLTGLLTGRAGRVPRARASGLLARLDGLNQVASRRFRGSQ